MLAARGIEGGDWQFVEAPAFQELRRSQQRRRGAQIDDRTHEHDAGEPELIEELLVDELRDLLHAEGQLVKALPKMARPRSGSLRLAFENHLDETQGAGRTPEGSASRLLGAPAKAKPCKGMAGLLEEGDEVIEEGRGKGRASPPIWR